MVGVRINKKVSNVVAGNGDANIKPFFIFNGWLIRKRTEKGNANYNTMEVGDIVVNGIRPDLSSFEGEWLGDVTGFGINDPDNYNSPGEYELNP